MSPKPSSDAPQFLSYRPVELRFGTSGLRGLVRDMTDLEVYINTRGFLRYLQQLGELPPRGEVAIGEDLRETDPTTGLSSSPRIGRAVFQAILDSDARPVHCGRVPTPAVAHFAFRGGGESDEQAMPSVMVTGSHIPADRNGVKFYRSSQEILKSDEKGILAAVAAIRGEQYALSAEESLFDDQGMLKTPPSIPRIETAAEQFYLARYLNLFAGETPLSGVRVVLYQHSAVGRDLIAQLLEALGAEVLAVGRSDTFVSVDTEDVTEEDLARYQRCIEQYQPDAIVSTDGDSDRPLLLDEKGEFHRGDVLGLVTAEYLGARFCAVPVSASDAIDLRLAEREESSRFGLARTRIGSPYVIEAMQAAVSTTDGPVVGWESNGGFMTQNAATVNGCPLTPLPTRDAVLPLLCTLLAARQRKISLSSLFAQLPQRATGAGLIDDFATEASQAIVQAFSPSDRVISRVRFGDDGSIRCARDGGLSPLVDDDALKGELQSLRSLLERYFTTERGFSTLQEINTVDGVRLTFANGEIAHIRPSGNAPQLRIYAISESAERTADIVSWAIAEPHGLLRQLERELCTRRQDGMAQRALSLEDLRHIVADSAGPRQVVAIANGGDGVIVSQQLSKQSREIFRLDGDVQVFAHEEKLRRGQLLGLLDAMRVCRGKGFRDEGVALGIMLPGKGTRLSPFTQRLHGIKPFFPMMVRNRGDGPFLSGAEASLFSWTLVAHHLERMGFRGVAWKWGDEPQIPAEDLSLLDWDLSQVDAIRFGSEVEITEDLARNKEWLLREGDSAELKLQVRRRSRAELVDRFGLSESATPRGLVHIGSPALSYLFMEQAEAVFGELAGWLDVDGYLFEALTHDEQAWAMEAERDSGLRQLIEQFPAFYERVGELRKRIEDKRGSAMSIRVVDFGADLYWGDVGQLSKARDAYLLLVRDSVEGDFARDLAGLGELRSDAWGNILVGQCQLPTDGSVRNSVVIESTLGVGSQVVRSVVCTSDLGVLQADRAVAVGCTVGKMELSTGAFAFKSVAEQVVLGPAEVHTSLPKNPKDLQHGLEHYRWQMPEDPGRGNAYQEPAGDNPRSFAEAFALMRQRDVKPELVEAAIEERYRAPLRASFGL